MAENDLVFNIGAELDTGKIKQDLTKLARSMPALTIPIKQRSALRDELISVKRGEHKDLIQRVVQAGFQEHLLGAKTATQALNNLTAGVAGIGAPGRLVLGKAKTELSRMIAEHKKLQKQENIKQTESRIADIISENRDFSPLEKSEIISESRRIQRIPASKRTEEQKKIIEVGNDLVNSLKDTKNTYNKQIGVLSSVISAATIAYKTAMTVYSEATREAPIGFEKAFNPAYIEGINIWLAKMGMSEEQAQSTQREMTRFVTDVQFGRRGNEIEALAKYGVGDIYRTMLSGVSVSDKIMSIQKSLSRVPASKRLALLSEVPWLGNIAQTLPYVGIAEQELPVSMEEGRKREEQANIALANRLKGQRVKYGIEGTRSENKRLIEAIQIGAGTGAVLMALKGAAIGAAGGPLGLLLGAGLGGFLGAFGGGPVGAVVDTGFRAFDKNYDKEDLFSSRDELFDYSKPIPVQDVSQKIIENNITIQLDSEDLRKYKITSNAEMGVM